MEDEERLKKLEAGKAKLAEYRQRKAYADSQKKQKKKKKKKESEGDSQERLEVGSDRSVGGEDVSGGGRDESERGKEQPTTEFNFTKRLKSGETVKHDQTYRIEPESEISTTAEDYSSEDEMDPLQQVAKEHTIHNMEDTQTVQTQAEQELNQELKDVQTTFESEGAQQLQDFEVALKQRDGIITQLTSNLQQAREEKDEIMKEFLALTEQSQKLQIQFQQLQAGETLRNTSHSSTAADLLQARQQLVYYQQQLEEMSFTVGKHEQTSGEQLEHINQLQDKLKEMELVGRRSEESFNQRMNEKDSLIAKQETIILNQNQSLADLKTAEESHVQTLKEKNQFILEQNAIITEHERSLTVLGEELAHMGRTTDENIVTQSDNKDLIIAEQTNFISALQEQLTSKETELKLCMNELESVKSELKTNKSETESCKLQLEKGQMELENCKAELAVSRQKERMSSNEIMQLMGTVEELQKKCHQGSVSESGAILKAQEDAANKLDLLRAELDEMYGQQIVQMKQELNRQHAISVKETAERHQAELELLKGELSKSSIESMAEVESLNAKIRELQITLDQSQVMQDEARHELSEVLKEKSSLQAKVDDLLQELHSAKDKMGQVSKSLISQKSKQDELEQLQETIDSLRKELSAAQETAQEVEAKHESEITNYKIKLEMLEREKDAVLDRMAESQEAELERLRTQLLFSHEEELTLLREELQRENFLSTENLLNEAAIRHEKALDELRISYGEELRLLQNEKASSTAERDELLHQILGLKEDLKMALQDSKAEQLVQQLQEIQVELEDLRKGAQERARMQSEIQMLQKKTKALEEQIKERECFWESKQNENKCEKENLFESNNFLKKELESNFLQIETLKTENSQIQQCVVELREEIEKQRTTFSFAEKNFEVNYQELKDEYTCLTKAKTQLEEKTVKDTQEFQAKIANLQLQIRELEESKRDTKAVKSKTDGVSPTEKESQLKENLDVALGEKRSLTERLSEVTEQLMFAEKKVDSLELELMNVQQENAKVIAQNQSLEQELEKKQELMREKLEHTGESAHYMEDHQLQIQSLKEEIKALHSLLHAAETERDSIRQTLELHRLSHTPSPVTALSSGEGPVEGRSSPHKPVASGSSRRKRRQRSKQERKAGITLSDSREEEQREEEEQAVLEEETTKSGAEEEMQPQMQSQVMSCSQERVGKDSTDGHQGDGGRDHIKQTVSSYGKGSRSDGVMSRRPDVEMDTTKHDEFKLQMAAQHISLSQIHAAQLEILQEESCTRADNLEKKLRNLRGYDEQDQQSRIFRYQNTVDAISDECNEIILSFQQIFGEEFLESLNPEFSSVISEERLTTSEATTTVLQGKELYRNLLQLKEKIEQEHHRLSQLQALLRADKNKINELQMAYDDLKNTSEKEISDLRTQIVTLSLSSDTEKSLGISPIQSIDLQKLKAETQEKQQQLENSHRQDMERLRAHFQQQASETEQRYATELFMLQQRLQEVTATDHSPSHASKSQSVRIEEHREELKYLGEKQMSEGGEESHRFDSTPGLSAQLQALRKALYEKYMQEVAALKEQHDTELRRLREEKEQECKRREEQGNRVERGQQLNGVRIGSTNEDFGEAGQIHVKEKEEQEKVEEEVAKAIVQMSVEFAQKTELARITARARQTNTSMQTQWDEEEGEDREVEEQTPRASPTTGAWMEDLARERLEMELKEKNAEIISLKEELQKIESKLEEALKASDNDDVSPEERRNEESTTQTEVASLLTLQGHGESFDKDAKLHDERNMLLEINQKLSQVLVDVLKTTAAAEKTLGLHMQSLSDSSGDVQQLKPIKSYSAESSSETGVDDLSVWSEESLELSQQIVDSLLLGAEPHQEKEKYLMSIGSRLQTTLEKMLMAITDTTNQLEHARLTQTELMRESFHRNQEKNELLQKQEELQERFLEEAHAREQLALELHRAEDLIDGHTGERSALEEQLRQKEELYLSLQQELQVTSSRLQELEEERVQMQEERELLSRQQDAMREEAGPRELCLVEAAMVAAPEADLLEETEKLMKEKVEVQRQAEKDNTDLVKQIKLLEAELEEQVNRVIELEHAQTTESGDLRQQVQALEKQLEKNRKFLDEQAVDREHERDFFQQEIQKLEQQMRSPQKLQLGSEQRNREVDGLSFKVEQLSSQLKEKTDWCSELLLSSEQLQRELKERDEEIDKLESRIRELEQALLASAESLEKVEQKKQHVSITEAKHSTLEAQLQTEREALERKEKEICNLEEQLEQFREELENKSEEIQQLHMQLEIQRKEISSQQQFQENRNTMLQVMEEKDREIVLLNEQITKLQHMDTGSNNKELNEHDELIKDLESQVECLRSEQERLKKDKEEELEQLNAVIEKLQQELSNIEHKQATEEDEDTKGQPEADIWRPDQEEYSEMKQCLDQATKDLEALRTEHGKLLETYLRLKESAQALAETEAPDSSERELEEALWEKTAGVVVLQAQVHALEESAASRVEELELRICELEDLLGEKDTEIIRCRLLKEQTQSYAEDLEMKVSNLEENLREKVAAALVSQATLEAFQQQQSVESKQEPLEQSEPHLHDFGDFGIPQMDFGGMGQAKRTPTGKVVHLTQKLRDLEVGLSGMQKDQELQKQLLSSSEEDVLEYERRLAVLMDLLGQMKAGTHQRTSSVEESADEQSGLSELLQELQLVKEEAASTNQQLHGYKETCIRLEQELKEKTTMVEKLGQQIQKMSSSDGEETKISKLKEELMEAQKEAAETKEELNSCREILEKLQELLQEREMSIAQLKGELFQVKAADEADERTELIQELEEVRSIAVYTKELKSYKEHNKKLQEDLQVSERSLCSLKDELQEMRINVDTTKEELNSHKKHNDELLEELHTRELAISKLREKLQEAQTTSVKMAEDDPPSSSPSPHPPPAPSSTSQSKKKGGKQPAAKLSSTKDKPSVSRKSSTSSSKSQRSSSEQQGTALVDSNTQTEHPQTSEPRLACESAAKEKIEEVITEFQEKILQMQELHAAEILDMEARHISESESLRRDTQVLEEECKALKVLIEKLRSTEVPPLRQDRPTSQFKDGYASDSSSDYSQRTGNDFPSLQQEFRITPEGARRENDDPVSDQIKTLLREVHQEGMQVLHLSELRVPGGGAGSHFNTEGWMKERDALLATVDSLKRLIAQMQTHQQTQTPEGADWRAELLESVRQVFVTERNVLKNALYNQLDLLDTSDAIVHLNQLETRLAEQDAQHREAMSSLHTAERSSLLSEIHQLRAQMQQLHPGFAVSQPAVSLAAEGSSKEQRGSERTDGFSEASRVLVEELKGELSQTKLELETTLKAQHKHLKELDTLRSEVTQKASEMDALNDQLMEERKRSRDLQWAVEKEKCRTGRKEESEREEMEDLHLSLQEQKSNIAQLNQTLEEERQASSRLSQEVEEERLSFHRRLQELQVQLESERARAQEMTTALERRVGVFSKEDHKEDHAEEGGPLERLQKELDEKHIQVVDLLSKVEALKLTVVQKDEELTLASQSSRRDQETLLTVRTQLQKQEGLKEEIQELLEREQGRVKQLEEEKETLQEKFNENKRSGRSPANIQPGPSEYGDRTEDWVFQQKNTSGSVSTSPHVDVLPSSFETHHGPWRSVDKVLGKLHLVASKLRGIASGTLDRPTAEVNIDELSLVQSNIDEVITMLREQPGLPSIPESSSLVPGSSAHTLTERLLRQNAELTGFVCRLTEEKNDLRNHTLRLEDELRRHRQTGLGSGDASNRRGASRMDSSNLLLSQERESWTREKIRLEKSLQLAQAQVARLRGEIRSERLREISGPEAENAALKRMYGKYLRAESFRKALVYQKKYLLLLLGGFQECEEATLTLLCRMGGRPSLSSLESFSQRRPGLTRFRSAVRVAIALSRMRFLVKRWHRATGMSGTNSCGVNKNGSGSEVRDSLYLHPGGVEVYRGGGGGVSNSSTRGRSGCESPRSGLSSTPHRFHTAADHGALTCSHLQTYDPDRALTDYISRLEALQRRLGSVTSGASSYAQLHFGSRR